MSNDNPLLQNLTPHIFRRLEPREGDWLVVQLPGEQTRAVVRQVVSANSAIVQIVSKSPTFPRMGHGYTPATLSG